MSNPSQLYLLADHIKLSLLERQRAISLNLEPSSQDGHISRSLEQMRDGIEALEKEQKDTQDAGNLWAHLPHHNRLVTDGNIGHNPLVLEKHPNNYALSTTS